MVFGEAVYNTEQRRAILAELIRKRRKRKINLLKLRKLLNGRYIK